MQEMKLQKVVSPISVVLPVYRDVKITINSIESAMLGILSVPNAKMIVINDSSPDEGMQDALGAFVERWPEVFHLLVNDKNLGFVATVNKGMRYFADHDIVLLNSDVIVPKNWLNRLQEDAYSRHDAATVTPMSNNTTICTFPEFLQDNHLPFGLSVQEIDDVFYDHKLPCVEAPTGIGFCMYIKRAALNIVGYFNEERFGRGYGEENDFCQRAIKNGFVNLISPNIFVYHIGGVSFGNEKQALIQNAIKMMNELHPKYQNHTQEFITSDPLRNARISRFASLISQTQIPKILHVSHGIGGGVDQHIEELAAVFEKSAIPILLVPHNNGSSVELRFGVTQTADSMVFDLGSEYDRLIRFLRDLDVSLIHYHHFLRLNELLLKLPVTLALPHVLTIHDFFLLNGNPTLTNEHYIYPGVLSDNLHNPLYPLPGGMTPQQWRNFYRVLVESAKIVIFPSQSTRDIFGDLFKIRRAIVTYHPEIKRNVHADYKGFTKKSRYVIATIGALSKEKGADILEQIALLANKKGLALDFKIIGYAYRHLKKINLTGPYKLTEIKGLIQEAEVDLFFFPARWPETYSYTLSYALETGLPIVAPNIGAFTERLAGRKGVMLFEHLSSAESLLIQLVHFISQLEENFRHVCPESRGFKIDFDFYSNNYLECCQTALVKKSKKIFDIEVGSKLRNELTGRKKFLVYMTKAYMSPYMRWIDYIVPYNFLRTTKRFISKMLMIKDI